MNKLTLRELAPYLPYGLKGVLTFDRTEDFSNYDFADDVKFAKGAIWQLCGYADEDLHIPLGEGEIDGFLWRNDMTYVNFHLGILPILRPLLDLVRDIEINGEKFVPIESFDWGCLNVDYSLQSGKIYFYSDEDWNPKTEEYTKAFAMIDFEDNRFIEWHIMEKLIEWHFDVFGLIDQGLAIDISTLQPTK